MALQASSVREQPLASVATVNDRLPRMPHQMPFQGAAVIEPHATRFASVCPHALVHRLVLLLVRALRERALAVLALERLDSWKRQITKMRPKGLEPKHLCGCLCVFSS